MVREVVRTGTDRAGNKVDYYSDDTYEVHKESFGREEIHVYRQGGFLDLDEEIGVDHPEHHPLGTTTHHIDYPDGSS